jgi:hypothetical protein
LLFDRDIAERIKDFAVDGINRLLHTLAEIARLVAVAQLNRFMRASRSAGRHRRTANGTVFQHDIDFDRGIAAAVENFAADDIDDSSHEGLLRQV